MRFAPDLHYLCILVVAMEKYIVSARKYRPSTFKTVVGQHELVKTLKNAVTTGRLAHSYLFCGQRGVGKTSTARIFAKAINCEHLTADGEPCNECESCRAFNEQRSLNIIELDAASNNSVDDIRQLTEQVRIPPVSGKCRVFIIDEVHMLSASAFNAFLKTLEEPPAYVIFILATTERQKILPTILSRCQKYDFQSITPTDIAEQLQYIAEQEGYATEAAALNVIAQKADGAMRDALSIFDQVAASSMGNITYQSTIDNLNILDYDYYFRLTDVFLQGKVEQALLIYKEVRDHGFDSKVFINGIASHFRELMMAHSPELLPLMETSRDLAARYQEQSARCPLPFIYSALDLCNTSDLNYRDATNKQLLTELTLIKICQLLNAPMPPQPQPTLKKIEKSQQPATAEPTATATATPSNPTATTQPETNSVSSRPISVVTEKAEPYKTPLSPKGKKPLNIPRFSLKESLSAATKPQTSSPDIKQPNDHKELRSAAYSYEDFKDAWRAFVVSHPADILLINSMKAGFPAQTGENVFDFVVENQAQIEMIERKKAELLQFLRDHVKNDRLTLSVTVRKAGEKEKLWTQKDLLLDIVERNPKVRNFIDKYRLGFA